MSKIKELLSQAFSQLDEYNKGGATQHNLLWKAMGNIEDLEKLKIKFLSQRDNIENIIGEIINNIRAKKLQVSNHALREHPYYKDTASYLKVVINDGTGYTVTKITPGGKCIGLYQFNADNTNFLKYYKICSQSEWESAIDRLNIWFKDASLKIKKL